MKVKKNKIKSLIALCLVMSVLASACSPGRATGVKKVKLETGKIGEDSIVMVVGDQGVRYSEIMAYEYLLKLQYEGSFSSDLWKYSTGEETIGDEAKKEIINMVTEMKVIEIEAKKQKVKLDNDEKDQALQKAEDIINSTTEENKKKYFLTTQVFRDIFQDNILAEKMFYINTDDADTEVSDEEAETREEKEKIIKERQNKMFKEKYTKWNSRCDVKISNIFWNEFSI